MPIQYRLLGFEPMISPIQVSSYYYHWAYLLILFACPMDNLTYKCSTYDRNDEL